jgi:hypothetical protein
MYWPPSHYDDTIKQPCGMSLHHVRKYDIYLVSFIYFKSSTNSTLILAICECYGPQFQMYALVTHINNSTLDASLHPFLISIVEHISLISNLLVLA